jgi:hypothetical protein
MVKGAVKRVASSEACSGRAVCPSVVVKTKYKLVKFSHSISGDTDSNGLPLMILWKQSCFAYHQKRS